MIFCIYIKADNCRYGNPRRAFVVQSLEKGNKTRLIGVYDEGYNGWDAIPKRYRKQSRNSYTVIHVGPREYRSWLKAGEDIAKGG